MIDLEAKLSGVLRNDADVTARVADRVWLNLPGETSGILKFPCVLIRRTGGVAPVMFQGPQAFDAAEVDVFAYGGSRVEALGLAQACSAAACAATAVFTCRPFSLLRIPDNSMPQDNGRDRERYILSLRIFGH